jgi:hypothetical protein
MQWTRSLTVQAMPVDRHQVRFRQGRSIKKNRKKEYGFPGVV